MVAVLGWGLAVLCYRRVGEVPELAKDLTVSSASPFWRPPVYFALTVLAGFFLSQVGFGVTVGLFSFLRGLADAPLLMDLAGLASLQLPEKAIFKALVLMSNSPLFLWSLVLGAERSLYLLTRLRGMPVPSSEKTLKEIIVALSVSFLAGLACSLAGT